MKAKGAFAFNMGGLTNYTKENEDSLLVKSIMSARTVDLIDSEGTFMTGVKYKEKINLMATDAIFQDGANCTPTASGSTAITQRTVEVGTIRVVENLCIEDMVPYYTSLMLRAGANQNTLPNFFETKYTDAKADTIAKQLEIAIWQGDTDSGNENLNKFDGFIEIIDTAATAIAANSASYISGAPISSGTGITTSNVRAIVDAMWLAQPADIQGYDDIRIFCGWDVFYKFIKALTDANLYHYAAVGNEVNVENGEINIPGTNYKLTAVHGLDGTNRLFSGRMYNFVAATDLMNDWEEFAIKPDQFDDYLRFSVKFRFGVQVAFPDQIVQFQLS